VAEKFTPFDGLSPSLRARLIDDVRDHGEGPMDKTTTEGDAVNFLRTLNEDELTIWIGEDK
jgi:hypothetical protein